MLLTPLPLSQTVTPSRTPSPLERDVLYGRPHTFPPCFANKFIFPVTIHFPHCFAKIIISPLLLQIVPPCFRQIHLLFTYFTCIFPPTLTMMHLCITQCTYWTPLTICGR